jgi:hypothetical protein
MRHRKATSSIVSCLTAALVVGGCASSSKDIAGAYISPMQYQSYDCDQLSAESARLSVRVQQLGGRLDEAASNDKALTTVSLILFWPAAFALGGNKTQEAEYARIKGEFDALQQAAVAKRCPGVMPTPAPAAAAASAPSQPAVAAAAAPAASAASAPKLP